jgi:hypothetical protein
MLGEQLWSNPLTYGCNELDQLIGTCAAYGFTTTGYPTDWAFTKYYDRDLGSWAKSAVWTSVNAGTGWVNHAGHTNSGYAMRLSRSDVTDVNFTNDGVTAGFPIAYSYGCYAGSFDNRSTSSYESVDCIGELMCTIQHFSAAFIGNSRYGWFTEGTTNGPSHHYQREFFDAMFTEGITTLGEANVRSKDETVPFIDLPDEYEPGAHRWCFYVLNVLGDPALDAWTDIPATLSPSHDPGVPRGDTLFAVNAVPGAVACLYRDGLCYGRGVADEYGYIPVSIYRAIPPEISALELDVRAHDRIVYRDTIAVLAPAGGGAPSAAVSLAQNRPNPFNPSTEIRFTLPRTGPVDIRAYDAAGREVARIFSGTKQAGEHSIAWRSGSLPSGVYFYVLRAGGVTLTRKAVLLR